MKKLLLFLFLIPLVQALPYADHIIELNMSTSIQLEKTGHYSKIQELTSEIYAFPKKSENQKILELVQKPVLPTTRIEHNKIVFNWKNVEKVSYGYHSKIERKIKPVLITSKEKFPIQTELLMPEIKKYLLPSKHVDSENEKIQKIAKNIAEGEDDLWNLVVGTAAWIKRYVHCDLSTLTTQAVQKASKVLEDKKGVCDEITALFMALLRANNIPVKFVYGITYVDDPVFPQKWGRHGWAEVYFPNHGWIPFDPIFNQYGWLGAGHVKLQESTDPELKNLQVTWRGRNYKVNLGDLNYTVSIKQSSDKYSSNVEFKPTVYSEKVSLDSYNLIIVTVKNKNNYYATTNLILEEINELEIIGEKQYLLTFSPGEEKQVYYTVKIKPGLNEKFNYKIPIIIHNEKNETSKTQFIAGKYNTKLTQSDINKAKAILKEEKIKPLSHLINLNCTAPLIIEKYENKEITCNISSDGNYYFENATVCLFQKCKEISFSKKAQVSFPLILNTGKNDLRVIFRHEKASKSQTITVEKNDLPKLKIENINYPKEVKEKEIFKLNFTVTQKSYKSPDYLTAKIVLPKQTQKLKIKQFDKKLPIELKINSDNLRNGKNKIYIILEYDEFKENKKIIITKKGGSIFKVILNGIIDFFVSIGEAFSTVFY